MDNKMLMALTEGGLQHLAAGARANVGVKAGRYAYELKIMEALNPAEAAQGRGPQPKQLVRVGFSTAASPLLLADNEEAAFFDSEGWFTAGKLRQKKSQLFTRDQTVAVVLNLDASSELANTMSIFRDGVRISEPQPIPESMRNKTLFPHISYRNVSLQINMGPDLLKPLPFECRMLQSAAAADVAEAKDPGKSGRCEVLVPVGVPDEGTFEWLDDYLTKHPSFVELSDRKIQDWAASSGLPRPRIMGGACNDKPSFAYNLPTMEDGSIQRVIKAMTPMVPRNYLIMEVKSNLVKEERMEILQRYSSPHFKKTALVVMGEPSEEFKQKTWNRILAEKQSKVDAEWKAKKAASQRARELQELRKKAEEQRRKKLEEARKKEEEAKKAEGGEDAAMEAKDEDQGIFGRSRFWQMRDEGRKGLFVHVSNLAGEELCSVGVPGNTKNCDLKGAISRQLGLYPYSFKLITLVSGATVEGCDLVSSISQNGRLDVTLVKIDGIPTPDSHGYLQLQPDWSKCAAPSSDQTRCATRVLALLVALVAVLFVLDGSYCGLLLVYAVYLLEALFLNPTARGLLRLKHTDRIMDYIEEVKACRPIPEVQARCYHHERRTRVATKPNGGISTVVYTKRVDTATFTERLQVQRWADLSGEVVEGLSYFPLLQVHFKLKWQAADDETRRTHEQQQHRLRARAANADTSYDITDSVRLVDPAGRSFRLYSDMIGTTGDSLPLWLGFWPYVVSSILGLSWPYRYWLAKHAVKGDFTFFKRVWSA
ncbi:Hnrnpu [Symbiodinium sp. CCMP2592]|nr:Hnrnpu [Symbiodinium sp. CCMP2592]